MASVASASPSAHSHRRTESNEDSDSWQQVSSNPASVFFPSPGSGSMASWMMSGYPNNIERSPQGMSPLHLDHLDTDSQNVYAGSFPGSSENVLLGSADELLDPFAETQQFVPDQDFMFSGPFDGMECRLPVFLVQMLTNKLPGNVDLPAYYNPMQNNIDFSSTSSLDGVEFPAQPTDLGIPSNYRDGANVSPWTANNLGGHELSFEHTTFAPSDASQASPGSTSQHSPRHSPVSPSPVASGATEKAPKLSLRKLQGKSKVEKKKAAEPASKFLIMTPMLINAASGKPNPYECFEAMRMTHKGRKGPLANDTKQNALHVRRLGACFCCHARKVKVRPS